MHFFLFFIVFVLFSAYFLLRSLLDTIKLYIHSVHTTGHKFYAVLYQVLNKQVPVPVPVPVVQVPVQVPVLGKQVQVPVPVLS